MIIEFDSTVEKIVFVASNPLIDKYHLGCLPVNTRVGTGQPFFVYGNDWDATMSLVFSSYAEDDYNEAEVDNIPHAVNWSVYTDEAEIDSIVSILNSYDFLIVHKIKHPTNNEWSIPVSDQIFAALPEGTNRDFLASKATISIAEGRRFDTATMILNGWV